MVAWSDNERIVVLFFLSRFVSHLACAELLQYKLQSPHDTGQLRNQVRTLKAKIVPEAWDSDTQTWKIEAVDNWILSKADPNTPLLTFGEMERRIIAKHQDLGQVATNLLLSARTASQQTRDK